MDVLDRSACAPACSMSADTETGFRQKFGSFRWAGSSSGQTNTAQASRHSDERSWLQTNPLTAFSNSISGYIPVRSGERTNEEEAYFALSRWERFLGFLMCCVGASICFLLAFLTLPLLAVKPRKFAVAFSMGSLLFMLGFSILQGPLAHMKHIIGAERLPFTVAYVASLVLTLYFAVAKHAYIPTLICCIVQVVALLSYFFAYFPGGITTLQFGGRIALRGASNLLPV